MVNNGLGNRPRLTKNSYRAAVAEDVGNIQGNESDQEMAEAWGVSAGTVGNARNRNHDLSAIALLQLIQRFGPESVSTVMALVNSRAVPLDALTVDISKVPCNVAKGLPLLIELFADGNCCDADVRQLDQSGVIDMFQRIANDLTARRSALALRSVA